MPAGRPPKYNNPEEMQEAIDAYFVQCEEKEEIPLISGLAYFLGFESRQSLYDYLQKEEFSYTIRRVKLLCEDRLNQLALTGKANPQIAKLNLATNYGYSDKQKLEHEGKVSTEFSIIGVDANTDSQED